MLLKTVPFLTSSRSDADCRAGHSISSFLAALSCCWATRGPSITADSPPPQSLKPLTNPLLWSTNLTLIPLSKERPAMSTFRGRQRNASTRIYGVSLTEQFASPHAVWFKIQTFTYSTALLPDNLQHSIEKVNQYNVSSIGMFATEGRDLLILSQSCVADGMFQWLFIVLWVWPIQ